MRLRKCRYSLQLTYISTQVLLILATADIVTASALSGTIIIFFWFLSDTLKTKTKDLVSSAV